MSELLARLEDERIGWRDVVRAAGGTAVFYAVVWILCAWAAI